MRIAHFASYSFGDIEKAHKIGLWQFGDEDSKHPTLTLTQPGDLVIISLNETDRCFVIGFARSKVRGHKIDVDWPGRVDMEGAKKDSYELDIATLTDTKEITRKDLEKVVEVNLTNQGCRYRKELSDVSELV